MARDNRQILRGIRIPVARPNAKPDKDGVIHKFASLTYTDGMEDELAAAFSQDVLDRLVATGSLSGDWKSTKPDEGEDKPAPQAKPRSAGGKFSPAATPPA